MVLAWVGTWLKTDSLSRFMGARESSITHVAEYITFQTVNRGLCHNRPQLVLQKQGFSLNLFLQQKFNTTARTQHGAGGVVSALVTESKFWLYHSMTSKEKIIAIYKDHSDLQSSWLLFQRFSGEFICGQSLLHSLPLLPLISLRT